jgi:hypothetical protein
MKVGASFVRERLRLGEGEWGGMVCEEGGRGRLGGGGAVRCCQAGGVPERLRGRAIIGSTHRDELPSKEGKGREGEEGGGGGGSPVRNAQGWTPGVRGNVYGMLVEER